MGATIRCGNVSIDVPYYGYHRLKRKVAEFCPEKIKEHFLKFDYTEQLKWTETERKQYDERTEKLWTENKKYRKIINFLYSPDCDAEFSYGTAKDILKIIGDYDDNSTIYGYAGWGKNAARFSDFKKVLQESAFKKKRLIVY